MWAKREKCQTPNEIRKQNETEQSLTNAKLSPLQRQPNDKHKQNNMKLNILDHILHLPFLYSKSDRMKKKQNEAKVLHQSIQHSIVALIKINIKLIL